MSHSAALVMRATVAIIILRELSFCFGRAAIAALFSVLNSAFYSATSY